MEIFVTGASGYIGGSVAVALVAAGHTVSGLVRREDAAGLIAARGIRPVIGTLDDADVLAAEAAGADGVVNTASADHEGAIAAFLGALEGTGKTLIHTSGSSIVGWPSGGERSDDVFDEETPLAPSPGRAARVALNGRVLGAAGAGVRAAVVCPSLIYGLGHLGGRHSMQIPWLIETARRHGAARHLGPGENIWSNVHIDDLVALYLRVLEDAPAGAFYYAENGEASMRTLCAAISRMLGFGGRTEAMTLAEASAEWGAGPAANTMGSNSRVRAVRARRALGWLPSAPSAIAEIEDGCYRI